MNRKRILIVCIIGLGVLGLLAAARSVLLRPPKMNVLLITLDTTRADHIGCYGDDDALTPTLDALAERGVLFERAYTPVPLTLPAHASVMTGLYPPQHGIRLNGLHKLDATTPTLAKTLSQAGYSTAAFVASFVLDSRFGLDRGFSTYDDDLPAAESAHEQHFQYRDGAEVVDSALSWLKQQDEAPFFCWIHLYEPHHPYVTHEESFGDRFQGRPYDAEIAYVDRQLERVIQFLREQELEDQTLIVVAGDHGESLGEHGERYHGLMLYESTMRVPLIVSLPGSRQSAGRVGSLVSLVDLYPSILDCLDVSPKRVLPGRSIKPALFGKPLDSPVCYGETEQPTEFARCSALQSVTSEGWRYIRTSIVELYDLQNDPLEQRNLAASHPEQRAALEKQLAEFERSMRYQAARIPRLSNADRHALKSLGYAGGGVAIPTGRPGHKARDVKNLIQHINSDIDAVELMQQGNYEEALPILQSVAKAVPDYFEIQLNLGICLAHKQEYDEAARRFQQALDIVHDRDPRAHVMLAKVHILQQRPEAAVPHLEKAIQIGPASAETHFILGDALRQLGRLNDARRQYARALRIDESFAPAAEALKRLPTS